MAAALPDRVDCTRLAADSASVQREYELASLPRLQDVLADHAGSAHAQFRFRTVAARPAASVRVETTLQLVCQRCLKPFALPVDSTSEIEFAESEESDPADPDDEVYVMDHGMISLKDLVEEELLLAVPVVPTHGAPETCGAPVAAAQTMTRPFAALQDLLKKT
jgi:uncharacterized protein